METVYYNATSCNYYWGVHGLSELSVWEDIRIFLKHGEDFEMIGFPCICSKEYFSSDIDELIDEYSLEDKWIQKVMDFLKKNETVFHYYYDDPEDEDFREVSFEAERNENGVKPRSLEMWYPSKKLDRYAIEDSIRIFCSKFLGLDNIRILEKEVVHLDDAMKSLLEHERDMSNFAGISISEEVIEELSEKTGKTIEEVNKLIELSLS